MRIQSINNNYQNECKNKNPNFGILRIEPSRRLAKNIGRFSGITDIETALCDIQIALKQTKYIHGNITCGKNFLGQKVPKLQVMIPKNLNLPETGVYEITNSDDSKVLYKVINKSEKNEITIYPYKPDKRERYIPFNDRYIADEENYKTDKSIELHNMHVDNGYKIFDIKDNCSCDHDSKYGNKFFPVQFGELFVNRILNMDNLFQALADGRATKPYQVEDKQVKYTPYDGDIPFIGAYDNKAFWDKYKKFEKIIVYV